MRFLTSLLHQRWWWYVLILIEVINISIQWENNGAIAGSTQVVIFCGVFAVGLWVES